MADKLKITLVKSTIGAVPKHVKTVEALGLKKLTVQANAFSASAKEKIEALGGNAEVI